MEQEITLPCALIGICGRKMSGKNTFADYLSEEYGYVQYAFADPIKKACKAIFGFTDEQCWGNLKEVSDSFWNITPRKALQIIGTELFQYELPKYASELANIGRTFWVQCFARWYEQQLTKFPDIKVAVTDVRFPFEADFITRVGGSVVKVVRPSIITVDTHASETEMDAIQYKFLIENNTTIDDLHMKIDELFSLM
jgi:hypothetical protein